MEQKSSIDSPSFKAVAWFDTFNAHVYYDRAEAQRAHDGGNVVLPIESFSGKKSDPIDQVIADALTGARGLGVMQVTGHGHVERIDSESMFMQHAPAVPVESLGRDAPATAVESDDNQDWAGMDGATAWHLMDRHANNWAEIGKMMDAWLAANRKPAVPVASVPDGEGRQEFERWAQKRHGLSVTRWDDSGEYTSHLTRGWWQCWTESRSTLLTTVPPANQEGAAP